MATTMAIDQLKNLIGAIRMDPARAPDGKYDQVSDDKTSVVADMYNLGFNEKKTLVEAIPTLASGAPIDDKDLMLENGVSMLQGLPSNSGLGEAVSNKFIGMLWNDLPHPPVTMASPECRYRSDDGSGNNPFNPDLGKAGSPYARNVPPTKTKGPNLPDPELVYEQLMKRKGPFREHPSGLNRLFFSFATVVIHECFQTCHTPGKNHINETSSYVDLSTLYGNNGEEQERVRTYEQGRIFPDSIASQRIMMMPPGVVAVLLMFSRNHNHIAENLLTINEDGKYRNWDDLKEDEKKWQDNDIFQLARNINVGFFATVVLKDYVAAILNTPRADSEWWLNLGAEIKTGGQRLERGTGSLVSTEFAVLYHWHAALSAADDQWMEDVIREAIPELGDIDDMTPAMMTKVYMLFGKKFAAPAKTWTFGGLERGEDGKFSDYDLAEIIKDCIEEPAHAFGAHGTPASLRCVDIMGMLQARNQFNVCTMNEFRRYLNLKAYDSFEEWNEDKETAKAAELLYGHIDNLELYPGLMAECTKPPMPGSGVCPGQTTGRGILDDAVALVRGDRFLSYDFNSSTLTQWGAAKISEAQPGAYGGMLPTLLMTGVPGAWTGTSSYALLPFYTPRAARGILRDNGVIDKYDTERPHSGRELVGIHTQAGCKAVFEDRQNFRVMYQHAVRNCTAGHDFMLGWDEAKRHNDRSKFLHDCFFEEHFEENVTKFFRSTVADLIKKKSLAYKGTRRSLNVVRDVCNVTPIMWLANRFAIPLKTDETPRGLLTIPQLFDCWLVLFIYQSFNILPKNEWKLREGASKVSPLLRRIFETHLRTQQGITEHVVDWVTKGSAFEVKPEADRFYHALNNSNLPVGDLVGDCIGMGAPVAGNITQQASLLIDLFLSEGYEQYKERIIQLAHMDEAVSERELQGFVFEGMRHAGVVPGLPRVAAKDVTVNDGARGKVHVKANQLILIATSKAAMDPVAFPEPEKLDPHRPFSAYTLLGHGLHFCFGARLVGCSLAATLREVFKLKNIRRAPGRQGKFHTVEHDIAGVNQRLYLDANAKESPIPTSLVIEYDE